MEAHGTEKLETTLSSGRRVTLSLPPTDAPWAEGGVGALRPVPPTHTGRGEEPPLLPEPPALPVSVALLGLGT
ncbi:hypothetical protein ACSMX9_00095 [Streptomyces sp. LE64]|uniref:hypothetical protein n=1 Tax=unclassified Streptomyces TaxID=2593676 RepID=UPI0033295D3A